ncbi:MAG TPA: phosphoribosylaminoimidazolesuccinocarboxamide synthase [Caulobacteraceae bacterium]|jgi:phosphoribosylaminoimidazole-succinocarboxamide synthase|nr:phosphoribosylaminoimidazolesuccinocarboxamide synthase [Caulobacteraceae bacterium]
MDAETLRANLDHVLAEATIPELPGHYVGKVRDNYDLPDGRRVLIATDRISAFDQSLGAIPFKGQVLTQIARFWFERTKDICPNHVLAYPDPNVLIGRRLDMLPVEIVVRGYLAGTTSTSLLTLYQAGEREMYGHRFADGLRANERLPEAIITPTTKADHGGHDEPITAADILQRGLLTSAQWDEISEIALALFARGQALAAARGLILADTKYEFGVNGEGAIVLADEIHTPDSSRYWKSDEYETRLAAGQPQASFDKDFVRRWVLTQCDPYRDPIPELPAEVVGDAAAIYIEAYESITGEAFIFGDLSEAPLPRIRRNLASLF